MRRVPLLLACSVLFIIGCEAPSPGDPDPPAVVDQGPCGSVWGSIPSAGRLYVDAAAMAGGDGTLGAPLSDLLGALDASRTTGERSIAIAAGTYEGRHLLEGATDAGLEIVGCGREETTLLAASQGPDLLPVIELTGGDLADVLVRDLRLEGGRRSLLIREGAGALGPIVAERLDVIDSTRVGVLVHGATTVAALHDVLVDGIAPDEGFGWGIAVQTSQPNGLAIDAPTVITDCEVVGAVEVGILAAGAWIEIEDTAVSNVAPDANGERGRGVQLQQFSRGMLLGVEASGNSDAAVFLDRPGRNGSLAVEIEDCDLSGTAASTLPDGGTASDGLNINAGDSGADASEFLVLLEGTTFSANPRSHVVADGVTIQMGSNNVLAKGTTYPFAAQGGATVEGIGGGPPGVEPETLGGNGEPDALGINLGAATLDDPTL